MKSLILSFHLTLVISTYNLIQIIQVIHSSTAVQKYTQFKKLTNTCFLLQRFQTFYSMAVILCNFIQNSNKLSYRTWRSQLAFVVKANSQMRHWKGLSPLWVLKCRFRVLRSALVYGHWSHLYGEVPTCNDIASTSISTTYSHPISPLLNIFSIYFKYIAYTK